MCKIKEGTAVQTNGDLQNLITSIILRQTATFSSEEIYKYVMAKLSGSKYENSLELKERCEDTISTLYLIDCLRSVEKGRYSLAMSFPSVNRR